MNKYVIVRPEEYDQYCVYESYPIETEEDREGLLKALFLFHSQWYEKENHFAEFTLSTTNLRFYWKDLCKSWREYDFTPPLILSQEEWFEAFKNVGDFNEQHAKVKSLRELK